MGVTNYLLTGMILQAYCGVDWKFSMRSLNIGTKKITQLLTKDIPLNGPKWQWKKTYQIEVSIVGCLHPRKPKIVGWKKWLRL